MGAAFATKKTRSHPRVATPPSTGRRRPPNGEVRSRDPIHVIREKFPLRMSSDWFGTTTERCLLS